MLGEEGDPYGDPRHDTLLGAKGSFLGESKAGSLAADSKFCRTLLKSKDNPPSDTLFDDRFFGEIMDKIQNENEVRVVCDIGQLISPSAEYLKTRGGYLLGGGILLDSAKTVRIGGRLTSSLANVYDSFVPMHIKRNKSAINQLPDPTLRSFLSIQSTGEGSQEMMAASAPLSQDVSFRKPVRGRRGPVADLEAKKEKEEHQAQNERLQAQVAQLIDLLAQIEEASSRPDAKTLMKVAEKTVIICDECDTEEDMNYNNSKECTSNAAVQSEAISHTYPRRSSDVSNKLGFSESAPTNNRIWSHVIV
ncbi:MAG: hypothetical protein Q9188_002371 [Gyalolechia gomerana]